MGNRSGFRFPLGFGVRRREGELERCRTEILAEREIASHQPGEVPSDGEAESDVYGAAHRAERSRRDDPDRQDP